MAQLRKQIQVNVIIKLSDDKMEEEAAHATTTGRAAFKDCMNHHRADGSTILLTLDPRIQAEYTVVDDGKTHWETFASSYTSKMKLKMFEMREDLQSIKLADCRDDDNNASRIDPEVKDCNHLDGPTTTDTDAANTNPNAMKIAKISEQQHIFYLLRGMRRTDQWKVFVEHLMDKNATMSTSPDAIIIKLVEKKAAIKRDNRLTPDAMVCVKQGSKGGRVCKVGRSPKRDKRDNQGDNDRKEKDL